MQIPYSPELRREAVAYLTKRKRDGESVERVGWTTGSAGFLPRYTPPRPAFLHNMLDEAVLPSAPLCDDDDDLCS